MSGSGAEILDQMSESWVYAARRNDLRRAANEIRMLRRALADLVERCDGPEGVRADGSNIDTRAAHAVLD